MTTKVQTVQVSINARESVTVTAPLAPGEKVVVASAALTAVLAGKTIRPAYHDEKLQVRYVRGVGLEWVGDAAVVVKTLSGPEYLWKSLNNEPESLWIIPGEPSKRGKWFSSSGTFVNVSDMTEGHLDNALSWLALKAAELKSEKRRREAKAKAVEAAKARDEKAKASVQKKRDKAKARYTSKFTETQSNDEARKAFLEGKTVRPLGVYPSRGVGFRTEFGKMLFVGTHGEITLSPVNQKLIVCGLNPYSEKTYTGGWEISK